MSYCSSSFLIEFLLASYCATLIIITFQRLQLSITTTCDVFVAAHYSFWNYNIYLSVKNISHNFVISLCLLL